MNRHDSARRDEAIRSARQRGADVDTLAARYGLCVPRIRQICRGIAALPPAPMPLPPYRRLEIGPELRAEIAAACREAPTAPLFRGGRSFGDE